MEKYTYHKSLHTVGETLRVTEKHVHEDHPQNTKIEEERIGICEEHISK